MRLTALQLLGFKSFPERTELRFGPGITGIVGPNGSGKSNVVDAVRWVLGEQNSRALRSPRVADLIFGGTADRKPLGMAQATLLLDNSDETLPVDYAEVRIVRRVHRSGESEFFINGTPCRLRDIQELLLGTGLGRGGMAVVGQGEIDAILSAEPAERRLLLEETAGTSRYRAQKRTAEQRLARAKRDLERVNDLSHELSERSIVLEAQAKTAARYRYLTEALNKHKAARTARDWLAASKRHTEAQQRLAEQKTDLEAAERRLAAAEQRSRDCRAEVVASERRAEQSRAALHTAESELAAAGHELQLARVHSEGARERADELAARQKHRTEEGEAARREGAALRARIASERAEADALAAAMAAAEERLTAYEARHEEASAQLEAARARLMNALEHLARDRNEARRIETEVKALEQQKARLADETATLAARLQAVAEQHASAEQAAAAADDRLAGLRSEEKQLAAALQRAREELARGERAVQKARENLHEVQATRRAVQRLEDDYAGYRPAVRAVLNAQTTLGGVRGTVAQLVEVPAKLDVAIQIALGGAAQFVVMDGQDDVLRAIEFLRSRRAGRATFLALDAVRPRHWPSSHRGVLQAEGVVGRAADLVRSADGVQPVVDYLLGAIAVVETLPGAQRLARDLPRGLRLVTLAGDLLVPGGPVTGGSAPKAAGGGLLSRRRELRELGETEQRATAAVAEAAAAADEAAARVAALEGRLTSLHESAQADALALAKHRQTLVQTADERGRLERTAAEHRRSVVALETTLAEKGRRLAALQETIATSEREEHRLRDELAGLTRRDDEGEAERRRLGATVADKRARLAARAEALRGLEREGERLEQTAADAHAQAAHLAAEVERARDEAARLQSGVQRLHEKIPTFEARCRQAREQVREATARVADARRAAEAVQTEVDAAAKEAADAQQAVWSTEALVARHGAAVDGHARRLEELSIDPRDAADIAAQADVSAREIRAMEQELESIGGVHLGAEEELAELRERLGFLAEQRADLEEAATSLVAAIERLDDVSSRRFQATLELVGKQFERSFQRLFGGGHARLVLNPEDDGVDVHVQMPGKRSQHLSALSGGERALTAIGLLFAILRVQPSPFYVLDEIDSALDEANLGRFQTLLKEAAEEAQFIVITHRATTMEVADALYGVTAAQPGVSTLISLDLEQAIAATA